MWKTPLGLFFFAAAVTFGTVVSAGRQAPGPSSSDDARSDRRQREALQLVCGGCHAVDVISTPRTGEEWGSIVEDMRSRGADGSKEEFALIDLYIRRNLLVVNVNTASAEALATVLDIDRAVGDAIVKYREARGRFDTVEDLRRVPGLEASKVDARKERLRF